MVAAVRRQAKSFQSYRDKSEEEYSSEESDEEYLSPLVDHDDSEPEDNEVEINKKRVLVDTGNVMKAKTNRRDIMKKMAAKRRRRSSSRFLSLSKRFETDDDINDEDEDANNVAANIRNNEELGGMYRQAIRMNTENRINAGNSWNFGLIENIDKFLCDEDVYPKNSADDQYANVADKAPRPKSSSKVGDKKRINFTKASCTLDASVKIYSYRVDDVHLSSYKVLANLNRTNNGSNEEAHTQDANPSKVGQRKQSERRNMDSTIEANVENLNISKIDSVLDIDPLFHKMSKSFDEGGAKGLLLVNLGVAADSCRVVFDSNEYATPKATGEKKDDKIPSTPLMTIDEDSEKEDMNDVDIPDTADVDMDAGEAKEEEKDEFAKDVPETADVDMDAVDANEEETDEFANVEPSMSMLNGIDVSSTDENVVDISVLTTKFESLLNGASFESVPFMPQMKSVREEYDKLEAEGFATSLEPSSKSKRYGISEKEEREAEEVIHREALERTRMSEMNNSFAASAVTEQSDIGNEDFSGDMDALDDGYHDAMNQTMEIQPSFYEDNNISFNEEFGFMSSGARNGIAPFNEKKTTVRLLDIICNADAISSEGKYEYFDSSILEKMTAGNSWAGSAHWKKGEKLFRKKTKRRTNDKLIATQKGSKEEKVFVDLCSPEVMESTITTICRSAKPKKGSDDPLQMSKSTIAKQLKEDNLLPHDAEIGVDQLFRLFLRPNSKVITEKEPAEKSSQKRVGFLEDNNNNLCFNDDYNNDEGPGFNILDGKGDINENDDFVIDNLEGVRKVDKVEVGYATVAKKVDVRRLKHDLWLELEERTSSSKQQNPEKSTADSEENSDIEEKIVENDVDEEDNAPKAISFQDVVDCLDESQRQEDVSVAFYFICLLHLANEKCLKLDSSGQDLRDFLISKDAEGSLPLEIGVKNEDDLGDAYAISKDREKREISLKTYSPESDSDGDASDIDYSDN